MPHLLSVSEMERPVEEIADVSHQLPGRACPGERREVGEAGRSVAQGLAAAIRDGCDGVPKERLCVGHDAGSLHRDSLQAPTLTYPDG